MTFINSHLRAMARYTKAQLEEFFYRQYEYIEALAAQLNLIKEQNELLKKENGP